MPRFRGHLDLMHHVPLTPTPSEPLSPGGPYALAGTAYATAGTGYGDPISLPPCAAPRRPTVINAEPPDDPSKHDLTAGGAIAYVNLALIALMVAGRAFDWVRGRRRSSSG